MTVSTETNRVRYDGDGSQTAFTVPFPFFASVDLDVFLIDDAGNAGLLALGTHYSVSGGDGSTGTVTMNDAPEGDEELLIVRNMPLVQETAYTENDPFPAQSHEDALDRLTLIAQQLTDRVGRSLRIRTEDVNGIDTVLPAPSPEMLIGWNGDGDGLINVSTLTTSGIVLADRSIEP